MIKSGLIARVSELHPHLDVAEVDAVVNAILTRIGDALAVNDRVELRGLGVFSAVSRAPRPGRNLSSGEVVQVGEKRIVSFKAGRTIKAQLGRPGAPEGVRRPVPSVTLGHRPRRIPDTVSATRSASP
ncbi:MULTISPECIES: HU family DNA-binding protein [Methylobacterium]|uniref:HU family DNA-binding protein n=1 Tax=Methylobacterium TaxID=407 RepID=UPI0009E835AB|nr:MULTISPECIES: HU family DNA-binding protein [Methylobacterium]MCI9881923.1 integration host factor subunit beta [Methylobacterium goesingense]